MNLRTGITLLFLMATVSLPATLHAQEPDSTMHKKQETPASLLAHSPKKATLYSAILPGLGQAYNKKYWKIPIVYAGFAGCTYLIIANNTEYQKFVDAYAYVDAGSVGDPPNDYATRYELTSLLNGQYAYRRSLEQSVIYTVVWYALNIIDATVDAHFFYFDISEDLSMNLAPTFLPSYTSNYNTGLSLTFRF